jgi:hypothetical protein
LRAAKNANLGKYVLKPRIAGTPNCETRVPSTAHWRLAATQEKMRKPGMQEGSNKNAIVGVSLRFLLSCLPAFLNSFPGKQALMVCVPGE